MAKFRKKTVVIEAVRFTGSNANEIKAWAGEDQFPQSMHTDGLLIETLEGNMLASVGDWVIKGVNGEFYPCKPDIFEKTYDPAD